MELNTKGINVDTVTVTDYKLINANLAKVIIAYTGVQDAESIKANLSGQMKHLAVPVEHSFRNVRASVAVGFVRANRAIRVVEDKEIRASYRVMSSNILMDNGDKTLWEVKNGAGGKYLARHGTEDLSELISASTNHRSDVPRLANIVVAKAASGEFVAFANTSGDMDYGYCTRTASDRIQVASILTRQPVTVQNELIAGIYTVPVHRSVHNRITAAGINRSEKDKEIEYYTRLYSYDQAYLALVKEQIETGTF